jgi:hypothetical protein
MLNRRMLVVRQRGRQEARMREEQAAAVSDREPERHAEERPAEAPGAEHDGPPGASGQ